MAQAADQVAVLILRPIPSAYGPDGARPWATLVRDTAGNLFGTTSEGGTFDSGTVFKLDPKGNETVLHNFTGGADGWFPAEGELALDAAGSIYGAASGGGSGRFGAVFKLDGTGTETVLHNFTGGLDGEGPHGSVVLDAAGNLYGTTQPGGDLCCYAFGCGVVFKLDMAGNETVLYSFHGGADGRWTSRKSVVRQVGQSLVAAIASA